MSSGEYVTDIEYSPLLGGFVAVLSDGRGFFLAAPNARFDKKVCGIYKQIKPTGD